MHLSSSGARLLLLGLTLASFGGQADQTPRPVEAAVLRANASEYPLPQYPAASAQANHTGRVVVDVVIGTNTKTSPLARVQSTRVVEAPDPEIGAAVVTALQAARYMPFFDGMTTRTVSSRVVWDFRVVDGDPRVSDPYAPARRATETTAQVFADDLRITERAAEILNAPAVWNRVDTRQCPPAAKTVSLYCALELATLDVTGAFDHRGQVMDDARQALDVVAPHHPDYDHWLMDYNNDPATSFADIRKVFQVTEERIKARIAR